MGLSPFYYEPIGQTLAVNILEPTVVQSDYPKKNFKEIIGNLRKPNLSMLYNPIIKIFLKPFIDFIMSFLIWNNLTQHTSRSDCLAP